MTAADPAWQLFQQRFGALRRARRTESTLIFVILMLLFAVSAVWTDFSPARIIEGVPRIGEYFGKLFSIQPSQSAPPVAVLAWPHVFGGVKEPQSIAYWFYRFNVYATLLWQTVQMAILATVLGYCAAFALSFPAARTLTANRTVVFISRRLLEFMRTIPQVVLAFILVWPFGIGPLAGVLAIAIHTTGALGKLFSELNENADLRAVEGVRAVGGSWLAQMRYGIVPQMLPGYLSYGLLRFEINVRSSTIIGFVGAGGIGQELKRVIGFNIYEEVSAICILILLIVVAIDLLFRTRTPSPDRSPGMSGSVAHPLPRTAPTRRALHWAFGLSAFAYFIYLLWLFNFDRIFTGLPKLWVIVRLMIDWSHFAEWDHAELLRSMIETVAMAFLGTFLAVIFALPLGFLGARNIVPAAVFRFLTRRIFDGCRGLDQFIWALVFVRAVGLGPIAGILAIMVAETGVLAKLFAEAIENIDTKQVDGIRSTGASRIAELRYGVLPQILPVLISQALYSIESNSREATILGLVGAGGIGLRLSERIQINAWDQVAYVIVLILITVALIDSVSRWLRLRLIGGTARRA